MSSSQDASEGGKSADCILVSKGLASSDRMAPEIRLYMPVEESVTCRRYLFPEPRTMPTPATAACFSSTCERDKIVSSCHDDTDDGNLQIVF